MVWFSLKNRTITCFFWIWTLPYHRTPTNSNSKNIPSFLRVYSAWWLCHQAGLPLTRKVAKPQVLTEGEITDLSYIKYLSLSLGVAEPVPSSEGAKEHERIVWYYSYGSPRRKRQCRGDSRIARFFIFPHLSFWAFLKKAKNLAGINYGVPYPMSVLLSRPTVRFQKTFPFGMTTGKAISMHPKDATIFILYSF